MSKTSVSKKSNGHSSNLFSNKSETQELVVLLNRFNKVDIISNFIVKPSKEQKTKQHIIKEAINFLTEKFTNLDELILFLYLTYIHTQKKERTWTVFRIKEAKRFLQLNTATNKLSHKMMKYFSRNGFHCKAYSENKGRCIWTVLFFEKEKHQRLIYLVTCAKLSLIFLNNVLKPFKTLVEKVIKKTFKCSELETLTVIKKNTDYFQTLNNGSFSGLQKNKKVVEVPKSNRKNSAKKTRQEKSSNYHAEIAPTDNQALSRKKEKDKAVIGILPKSGRNNNFSSHAPTDRHALSRKNDKEVSSILSKNKKNKFSLQDEVVKVNRRKRKCYQKNLENQPLPKVKHLQYFVKSSTFNEVQKNDNFYSVCGIKFKGSNVLKGLEHLVDSGIAVGPLPDHLYKEPIKSGVTDFVITM